MFYYREGRRASDGLVAQGILHSQSEYPLNSAVAFNSQRLHEVCKAKGVLELHLLQKEAAQLKTQYQSNLPADEMTVRQIQHTQFHVTPIHHGNSGAVVVGNSATAHPANTTNALKHNGYVDYTNAAMYHLSLKQSQQLMQMNQHQSMDPAFYHNYAGKAGDLSTFVGLFKSELVKIDSIRDYHKLEQLQQLQQQCQMQKPPLQQQLMQHRLLQQKRQILQKQVAMETGLSRRQMLRQQSYKIAQQQQILPPLPLNEHESEDLLAFQAIVEGPGGAAAAAAAVAATSHLMNGSPKMIMKTSHIQQQQPKQQPPPPPSMGPDCWNTLPVSMQTSCQISDATTGLDSAGGGGGWVHPTLYQVHYNNQR